MVVMTRNFVEQRSKNSGELRTLSPLPDARWAVLYECICRIESAWEEDFGVMDGVDLSCRAKQKSGRVYFSKDTPVQGAQSLT